VSSVALSASCGCRPQVCHKFAGFCSHKALAALEEAKSVPVTSKVVTLAASAREITSARSSLN
jgi:hypothetical protein